MKQILMYMQDGSEIIESGIDAFSLWQVLDTNNSIHRSTYIGVIPIFRPIKLNNVRKYEKLSQKHLRIYI